MSSQIEHLAAKKERKSEASKLFQTAPWPALNKLAKDLVTDCISLDTKDKCPRPLSRGPRLDGSREKLSPELCPWNYVKESANSDLLHTVSTNTKEKQHPKKQKFSPQNGKQIFLKQKKMRAKNMTNKKREQCVA